MSANDDAGSERKRLRLDDDAANFFYTGGENVPDGVTRVRIHPSIEVIRAWAFRGRSLLMSVELHDGIEVIDNAFKDCRSLREMLFPPSVREIKRGAFENCSGLTTAIINDGLEVIGEWAFIRCALVRIDISPSVRAIKAHAFSNCSELTTVILNDGLEEIGVNAFAGCALVRIDIPPSVRAIRGGAFAGCSGLTTAILNDGLEEIGGQVFKGCALERIDMPPAVRVIDEMAFEDCSNLTTVRFCDEIEEFVSSGPMRDWWNHGVHKKCLSTYCFLVQFNIPQHLRLVRARMWQTNIHGMLMHIPSIFPGFSRTCLDRDLYFISIDSKLSVYKNLNYVPTLLELAIWKSKITQQTNGNINPLTDEMKMECRIDSISTVVIIVPNVLTFF